MYTTIEDVRKPITLLLKGDSGTGKTYKAAHFPAPVFFNWDNNLSGLRKLSPEMRRKVRVVNPRMKWDDQTKEVPAIEVFDNYVKQLEVTCADRSVGTIINDSLTTMAEVLMDKIVKNANPGAKIEIQHWGELWKYFKWLAEELLCSQQLDKHVIWIAHEQLKEDKQSGQWKYFLSLGGQAKSNLDLFFSDVWRTYNKKGPSPKYEPEYWVRVLPTDYHTAKTSLTLPTDFKWDAEMDNILKQVTAGLPPPAEQPLGAAEQPIRT